MNTLDRTLELLAAREPDAATVNEAQRKLDALVAEQQASRTVRRPARPARGWLAAGASAVAAAAALLWLPLGSTPALAFAQVQEHFRDFRTLRFDVEQRMNGQSMMKSRIHVTRDGNVRTDVGDLISVIVNSSERRVMTLHHPAHVATLAPLVVPATSDDAMAWLKEIRDFQGEAKALAQPRMIGHRKAYGWELGTAAGNIVLWATEDGLPLEMTIGGSAAMQLDFDFEFDPAIPAQMFSTEIPAGYSLARGED
jgi:outer membrane lipoprotein-sorting protein